MNYDLGNVPPWGTLWWDHIYGGDIFVQNIIWNVNMSAPYKTYSGAWIETLFENLCIFKVYDPVFSSGTCEFDFKTKSRFFSLKL